MGNEFDILIQNGSIIDGTGKSPFKGDIGIAQNGIIKIDERISEDAAEIIDASGKTVSPGFIDMHSHNDMALPFDNRLVSMIRQGVTTSVIGNCGFSLAPVNEERIYLMKKEIDLFSPPGQDVEITWRTFKEYLETLEDSKTTMNIVPLVGFGAVRIAAGPAYENREPSSNEMNAMKLLVQEAMEAGAFGLSTGLIYAPQVYAETSEILELAKLVAQYDGLYFSHIRGEGETLIRAVKELIDIVEESGCSGGQIAHHKVAGRSFWGASRTTLQMIAEANERGLRIACDQYPYNRGATSLITVLPPWVHEGGIDAILKNLADESIQERIRSDVESGIEGWENMIKEAGWEGIYISSIKTEKWAGIESHSLAAITETRGFTDPFDMLFELLLDEKGEVGMTMESMGEDDIHRIMKSPHTIVGTDGEGVAPTGVLGYGKPHPRFYGTYPRILGKYVREEGLLSLEKAIWKMSGFPAKQLGLEDRGLIREGLSADLVLFNSKTVIDKATFNDPHQFPEGIDEVLVNGTRVVANGKQTDELPGVILRHKV
ncbi:MAG: N-acyl-D-amino-acid deacylase family protein [Candidatus Thorarchaeota archaeon]|jgi:N-acyl-D-amino-acid deacylase